MFSPEEIDKVRFTRALYGYSPLEVDEFLSHIKTVVTELCRENETLRAALGDSRFEGAKQRLGKGELERDLAVTARKLAEAAAVSETLKIEVAELRRELSEAGNAAGEKPEPEETAVEEADAAPAEAETETAPNMLPDDVYTAPDDEYGEDETPSGNAEGQGAELDDIYSDLQRMLVDWDEETDGADAVDQLPTDEGVAEAVGNGAAAPGTGFAYGAAYTGEVDAPEIGPLEGAPQESAASIPQEAAPTVYRKKTYHIKKSGRKAAPAYSEQETPEQEKEDEDILAALKSEYNTYNYIFGDGKK